MKKTKITFVLDNEEVQKLLKEELRLAKSFADESDVVKFDKILSKFGGNIEFTASSIQNKDDAEDFAQELAYLIHGFFLSRQSTDWNMS